MCLAIPSQIIEILPSDMAKVQVGNSSTQLTVSTMLLADPPQVGDYAIVHAGFILHKLSPQEAEDSLAALREMAQAAFDEKPGF